MHNSLRIRSVTLSLLSLGVVCSLTSTAVAQEPDWQAFDRYVAAAAEEWRVPGLSIAVVKDDRTVFERGYGVTSLEGGNSVDADTLFSIGSTTKAMTAAAIGMLVDAGKVDWDDPVTKHLPQFRLKDPAVTKQLRVRDLLTHNAGVPNTDVLWYEQPNSLDEILERMQHVDVYAPMYSSFTYQNVMYAAAGKLTEVLSGMSWGQFIERRLFKPLGMRRSVASLERTRQRDNVAQPHYVIDGEVTLIENASVDSVAAAGSVWSSAKEMALWARFLLRNCKTENGERLLTQATCAELFKPQAIIGVEMYPAMRLYDHHWLTYALGWFQTDYNGRALDFHSGSIDGLVALHGLIRADHLGVYILGNLDHAEVRHALMYRALDLYDDQLASTQWRDWNREIKALFDGIAEQQEASRSRKAAEEQMAAEDRKQRARPALANALYLGDYTDPFSGDVTVTEAQGSLRLRYGLSSCTLEHVGGDAFSCPWEARWRGTSSIQFIPNAESKAQSVRLDSTEFTRAQ